MSMIPSGIGDVIRSMPGFGAEPSVLNRERWWETPGVTFGPFKREAVGSGRSGSGFARYGQAAPFEARVPAAFVPEYGGDVRSFYNFAQTADPWMFEDVRSRGRAQNRAATARQTAIRGLGRMFGDVEDVRTEFREDPGREAMQEALIHRTSPDYQMITDLEEGAMRNRLAQAWAREQAVREGSAAGRGTLGGGTSLQNLAALRAIAASGGVQLGANVEIANRAARERALGDLGSFTDRGVALEQNFSRLMGGLQTEIARLEAGGEVMTTDYGAYEATRFGQEQFQTWSEEMTRRLDLAEESQEEDVWDLVEQWASAFPGFAGDLLSNVL